MAKVFGIIQRQYYDGLTRGEYSNIPVYISTYTLKEGVMKFKQENFALERNY
jgi:hypothetical protein